MLKKYLNQFDLIMVDDRMLVQKVGKEIGSSDGFMRKRVVPMPVKISGVDA